MLNRLPETIEDYLNIANDYFNSEKYHLAIIYYTIAIKANPEHITAYAYYKRAHSYLKLDKFDHAIADANEALKRDAKLALAYYVRGTAKQAQKKFSEALIDFNQGIILDPNYPFLYHNRGLVFYNLKHFERALADFNMVIIISPSASSYANRGLIYTKLDKNQLALQDYNKAIELDPHYVYTYVNRGYWYFNRSDYELALADLNYAYENQTDSLDLSFYFSYAGIAKFYLNDISGAIDCYSNALAYTAEKGNIFFNRARAYFYIQDYEKSITDYDAVLFLNKNEKKAYYGRCRSKMILGHYFSAMLDSDDYFRLPNIKHLFRDETAMKNLLFNKLTKFEKRKIKFIRKLIKDHALTTDVALFYSETTYGEKVWLLQGELLVKQDNWLVTICDYPIYLMKIDQHQELAQTYHAIPSEYKNKLILIQKNDEYFMHAFVDHKWQFIRNLKTNNLHAIKQYFPVQENKIFFLEAKHIPDQVYEEIHSHNHLQSMYYKLPRPLYFKITEYLLGNHIQEMYALAWKRKVIVQKPSLIAKGLSFFSSLVCNKKDNSFPEPRNPKNN